MWATLSDFLGDRRRMVGSLALKSLAAGLVEAAFLVVMSRAAFAITDDTTQIELYDTRTVSLNAAIIVGLGLIAARCVLALWVAAQATKLSTSVVAEIRRTACR